MVLFLFVLMLLNVKAEERAAAREGGALQGGGPRPGRPCWPRRSGVVLWRAARAAVQPARRVRRLEPRRWRRCSSPPQYALRVRGHLRPDPGRAGGRGGPGRQGRRARAGTPDVKPDLVQHALFLSLALFVHRRGGRVPAPEPHHRVHVRGADAQRGQPLLHGLQPRAATLDAQVLVFFVLTVAAAEAAVGLAIIIALHRHKDTLNVDAFRLLRWYRGDPGARRRPWAARSCGARTRSCPSSSCSCPWSASSSSPSSATPSGATRSRAGRGILACATVLGSFAPVRVERASACAR